MLKAEVINEVQKDEYKDICKRLSPNLYEDLYQDLLLILLEKDQLTFEKINSVNNVRYYTVGILLNMVRSNNSKFHRSYRNTVEITDQVYDTGDYDTEKDDKIKKLDTIIEGQYWFDKHIFKTYIEEGSLRKAATKTKIPVHIVRSSINQVKRNIKQNMEPIKILLITQKANSGLKFHRQISPHVRLIKTHPEFHVTETGFKPEDNNSEASIDNLTDEYLKEFKIIYYLRQISFSKGKAKATIERCHRLGLKVILDIDDNWKLNAGHMMYKQYKHNEVASETEEAIRLVDHVITTTDYFADKIAELNKNVTVLPNCINPDDPQFKPREIPNNRVRFGWIGGVYHKADMDAIAENFCRIAKDKEIRDEYQLCLGGYNVSKTDTGIIPNLEYHSIESTMTCNYYDIKHNDVTYMNYLYTFVPAMEHITYDKSYRRLYAKDVYNYGQLYNEVDVCLVPLISNEFNRCKSELKLVEAGTMGKPVIVSDTEPYNSWIKHGVNGLKVKESRNNIDWYLAMKKLIKEPQLRKDLAAGLKDTIEEYFDMDTHNEARAELYKSLI